MSIKNIWAVLCRRSVVDSVSNNISLFDGFETIKITIDKSKAPEEQKNIIDKDEEIKVFPVESTLSCLWHKEDIEKDARGNVLLEILDPSGKKLFSSDFNIEIKSGIRRLRSNTKIENLFVTKSGVYWYRVSFGEKEGKHEVVSEIPVEIELNIV